ncbi:hypothetical protein ISN45_At04g009720 [Arabidopsis thaliana x Arabidopsis arenosa]|uniref:Histone deacetylase n=2 Tax=Arabidopsis TaxID=3701 RepID=A0A5S9XQT0_ARATH|nr:hypothetical protein ISN45_At04g009720 [Arabidopsis thaliana x Arabidopsis arenosa]CAA0394358.1 unnamed protein product [Arabidopsis thaliana]
MLKKFEVKSHPHPERPDRLRAIAASLDTAGVFPGRCLPINAGEITKQELQMVSCYITVFETILIFCSLQYFCKQFHNWFLFVNFEVHT